MTTANRESPSATDHYDNEASREHTPASMAENADLQIGSRGNSPRNEDEIVPPANSPGHEDEIVTPEPSKLAVMQDTIEKIVQHLEGLSIQRNDSAQQQQASHTRLTLISKQQRRALQEIHELGRQAEEAFENAQQERNLLAQDIAKRDNERERVRWQYNLEAKTDQVLQHLSDPEGLQKTVSDMQSDMRQHVGTCQDALQATQDLLERSNAQTEYENELRALRNDKTRLSESNVGLSKTIDDLHEDLRKAEAKNGELSRENRSLADKLQEADSNLTKVLGANKKLAARVDELIACKPGYGQAGTPASSFSVQSSSQTSSERAHSGSKGATTGINAQESKTPTPGIPTFKGLRIETLASSSSRASSSGQPVVQGPEQRPEWRGPSASPRATRPSSATTRASAGAPTNRPTVIAASRTPIIVASSGIADPFQETVSPPRNEELPPSASNSPPYKKRRDEQELRKGQAENGADSTKERPAQELPLPLPSPARQAGPSHAQSNTGSSVPASQKDTESTKAKKRKRANGRKGTSTSNDDSDPKTIDDMLAILSIVDPNGNSVRANTVPAEVKEVLTPLLEPYTSKHGWYGVLGQNVRQNTCFFQKLYHQAPAKDCSCEANGRIHILLTTTGKTIMPAPSKPQEAAWTEARFWAVSAGPDS